MRDYHMSEDVSAQDISGPASSGEELRIGEEKQRKKKEEGKRLDEKRVKKRISPILVLSPYIHFPESLHGFIRDAVVRREGRPHSTKHQSGISGGKRRRRRRRRENDRETSER